MPTLPSIVIALDSELLHCQVERPAPCPKRRTGGTAASASGKSDRADVTELASPFASGGMTLRRGIGQAVFKSPLAAAADRHRRYRKRRRALDRNKSARHAVVTDRSPSG